MPQQDETVATAEADVQQEQPVEELTTEELIEDVSIDGMCGVY